MRRLIRRLSDSERAFDAVFTVLTAWMIAGVTWDFAVHTGGISFEEEGFLTLPHMTFYSAFLAITALMVVSALDNRSRGAAWREAVPVGYRYGLLGVGLFAIGGPLDVLWHQAVGAESGIEALVSPTHLLLATGAVLFLSSPLRAAWIRGTESSLRRQLPLLVSAGFIMISIAAFGMYGNPLNEPVATGVLDPGHGVLAVAAFTVLIVGMSLTLVRRFDLAPGALTVLFGLVALPFTAGDGFSGFLPCMIAAGVVADSYTAVFRPNPARTRWVRGFACVIPLTLFTGYFVSHHLLWGVAWSTHIWAGAIVVSVLVGLLSSYLVVPTGPPDEASVTRPRR